MSAAETKPQRSRRIAEQMKAKSKCYGGLKPFRPKLKPIGYQFGRPTLYKPEYCQAVVEVMGNGYDLTAFAGSIGVSREAVYNWIYANDDFRHAVEIAKAARLYALQHKLLNTAMGVGVTAAIFALKNADPDNWSDRYEVHSTSTIRIEHVSDAQLMQVIAPNIKTIEHQPQEQEEVRQVDER